MTLTEGPTDWEVDPWDSPAASGSVERLRRDTRAVKWAVWTIMVVVVVLVLVAGRIGWWYVKQINPEGTPGAPVNFTVDEGDTLEILSERLEAEGIIVNAGVFRWYVEEKGGLELTPGYYQLRPADHIGNIVGTLRTPPAQTYTKITFPEGFTIAQMATRLDESTDRMVAAEFITAANNPAVVSSLRPAGVTSLEGLLFPDTYQVSNSENEAQVVERMVSLMERVGRQEDLEAGAADLGYTPYQILIIASMIEREAKLPEDRAKIARVIYNRLGPFSPYPQLQIDATLLYNQDPGAEHRRAAPDRHARTTRTCTRGCRRRRSPTPAGRRSTPRCTRRRTRRPATRSARSCPTRPTARSTSTFSPTTTAVTRSR